jgi:hypothetical protein
VSGEEVLMKPMPIVMRHVQVGALLAGAVVLAGLALALPVLAALAPPEADADRAPEGAALPPAAAPPAHFGQQ